MRILDCLRKNECLCDYFACSAGREGNANRRIRPICQEKVFYCMSNDDLLTFL